MTAIQRSRKSSAAAHHLGIAGNQFSAIISINFISIFRHSNLDLISSFLYIVTEIAFKEDSMIRIRSIALSNVKNVVNGSISFKDSPFGSSVMGIYGQNGSGKTAVVESLARVQDLMCGFPLDRESVDLIGPSAKCARISIEAEVTEGSPSSLGFVDGLGDTVAAGKPFMVCYSFSFDRLDDRPRLLSENLSVRANRLVKRTLAAYDAADTEDTQNMKPVIRWRALRNLAGRDADLDLTVARRSPDLQASSRLFSNAMVNFAVAARKSYLERHENSSLSEAAKTAYESVLVPFMDSTTLLNRFADDKMRVCGTRRSAALAFDIFLLASPGSSAGGWPPEEAKETPVIRDVSLPIDQTTVLPLEVCESVRKTIETINCALRAIVPGLSIQVNTLHRETMEDGVPGERVELLSCRQGIHVPFRTESEGIKKIASMLGWLINVYNDDSACLVVDEIDSGVFEFLLGELLEVVTEQGKGQLIFTAHNLRALECLPVGCLVFSTSNPNNRYIGFRGMAPSNNLRNQYLRAINLGGQKEQLYEPTGTSAIGSALLEAGSPQDLDFDSLLSSMGGE